MNKIWNVDSLESQKQNSLKENYIQEKGKHCISRKYPFWLILILVVSIIVLLIIIIGLIIGLINKPEYVSPNTTTKASNNLPTATIYTQKNTNKPIATTITSATTSSNLITTTIILTTTQRQCKNFGLLQESSNTCECTPYFTGDYCEIELTCDQLPSDPPSCDFLKPPLVDEATFASLCPKSIKCPLILATTTTTTETTTTQRQCKNLGILQESSNTCECTPYFTGDYCEIELPCDQWPSDPSSCDFLKPPLVDEATFASLCPKSVKCISSLLIF